MKQICFVCQNVNCKILGSEKLTKELADEVTDRCLHAEVKPYLCFGAYESGPNIVLHSRKTWHAGVKSEERRYWIL